MDRFFGGSYDYWTGTDGELLYLFSSGTRIVALTPLGEGLWYFDEFPTPILPAWSKPVKTRAALDEGVVQVSTGTGGQVPLHYVHWAPDGVRGGHSGSRAGKHRLDVRAADGVADRPVRQRRVRRGLVVATHALILGSLRPLASGP